MSAKRDPLDVVVDGKRLFWVTRTKTVEGYVLAETRGRAERIAEDSFEDDFIPDVDADPCSFQRDLSMRVRGGWGEKDLVWHDGDDDLVLGELLDRARAESRERIMAGKQLSLLPAETKPGAPNP